jgi:hypothetical protein
MNPVPEQKVEVQFSKQAVWILPVQRFGVPLAHLWMGVTMVLPGCYVVLQGTYAKGENTTAGRGARAVQGPHTHTHTRARTGKRMPGLISPLDVLQGCHKGVTRV